MSLLTSQSDLKSLSLRNHFLISMPGLDDPNFSHSITYICEHNEDGAMGLVVNHTLPMRLGEIFSQLEIEDNAGIGEIELLAGGPVQLERGFVLHSNDKCWESTLKVCDDIYLTASREILEALAQGDGPKKLLVILGYAGWEKGQLEQEIAENSWLTVPANSHVLFNTETSLRWQAAADYMGIDLNLISQIAGHA